MFKDLTNGEQQATVDGMISCVKDPALLMGYERLLATYSLFGSLADASLELARQRDKVVFY